MTDEDIVLNVIAPWVGSSARATGHNQLTDFEHDHLWKRMADDVVSALRQSGRLNALDCAPTITVDDIRRLGWTVAVHNDYRLKGDLFTFWLFTKDGRCVKGEGWTDALALTEVMESIRKESK